MRSLRVAAASLLASSIATLAACGGDAVSPPAAGLAPERPVFAMGHNRRAETDTLRVGETLQLTANFPGKARKAHKPEWHSSDPAVASVQSSGVVTGNEVGSTKIRVTNGVQSDSATIIVLDESSTPVAAPTPAP